MPEIAEHGRVKGGRGGRSGGGREGGCGVGGYGGKGKRGKKGSGWEGTVKGGGKTEKKMWGRKVRWEGKGRERASRTLIICGLTAHDSHESPLLRAKARHKTTLGR